MLIVRGNLSLTVGSGSSAGVQAPRVIRAKRAKFVKRRVVLEWIDMWASIVLRIQDTVLLRGPARG
jgi:hypothetical protein